MTEHKKQAVVYLRVSDYSQFTGDRIVAAYKEVIGAILNEIGAEISAEFFDRGNSNEGFKQLLSHIAKNIPKNLIIIDCGAQVVVPDFNRLYRTTSDAIKFVHKSVRAKVQQERSYVAKR